jgi:hypothetical protein
VVRSAKNPQGPAKLAMRPVLLAAGLGIFWFVEFQDGSGAEGSPMWGYLIVDGAKVLADFVGAWVLVSAVQLAIALMRFGLVHLRALWVQNS